MVISQEETSCSQRKHASNYVERNSSALTKINESTINAVEFCCNILSRNGLGIWLQVDRFETYIDIAGSEIKCLVNSRNVLQKLLCSFPLVFHVVDNQVTLRSWIIFHLNQQEWLQKLLPRSFHPVPIYISAIQFYCNELFKIAPIFELPLHQLYSLKKKAPTAIKGVTKNIEEFLLFLQMYPDIFQLNSDKVILSKSALSYRSLGAWIKRLLDCDFNAMIQIEEEASTVFNYEVLKNEVAVYEAVGLYYSLIFTSGSTKGRSLEKLFYEYNRLVPNSTFLKNILDLESFITSYPEVFKLINTTVYLTQFHSNYMLSECASKNENHSNCSIDNGLDLKTIDQTVIPFYQGILYHIFKLPRKVTEFPIDHLLYYNVVAPPEVRKVAKDAKSLKIFLSQYPQIFKINNSDKIVSVKSDVLLCINEYSPTSTVDSIINEERTFVEKMKEYVSFYSDIIYKLGGTAKIKQLLDYNMQACEKIQSKLTNFEELKNFFCSHQNDFVVLDDKVCLANKDKEDNSKVCVLNDPAAENAISFYSNVLRNQKSRSVSLINISGHRGIAPADVQTVAKNPKELKVFFSQFPEVFTLVDDNKVMLSKPYTKMMSLQQQQETSSKMFFDHSEQDAVEYFSKMLNLNGICRVLYINELFELKLKSSPAIHKISGSNLEQFLAFLNKYPQEFIVTNDNVIAKKKIPKWSCNGKYENKKLKDTLSLLIFNFFKAYTSNKSLFHIDHLYNNVGRCFLYNDKTPVFPSKTDLLSFLGLYPHIFFVDHCRIVNIIASGKKAYVNSFDSKKNHQNISWANKPITPEPIAPNLNNSSTIIPPSKKMKIDVLNSIGTKQNDLKKEVLNSIGTKQNDLKKDVLNSIGTKQNDLKKMFPIHSNIEFESKKTDLTLRNLPSSQELEDCLGNNECTSIEGNDYKKEFNPLSIEEIEKNISSHFIGKVNKNCHFSKNREEHTSPQIGKILNNNFLKDFNGREDFNEPVTEALMFLNGKLWGEGNLKILNIEELYYSFSQSGLEMANKCCKDIKEFKNFLYDFRDHFIVSHGKVMAKRNKIQEVSYLLNYEEESISIMLFNFFNSYTNHFNFILLKQLFSQVGKYFCNLSRSPFFKSPSDLVLFLEMFPDVFRIDNCYIENITAPKRTIDPRVEFKRSAIRINSFLDHKLSVKHSIVLESTDGWKDSVLQNTMVIENISQCRVLTAEILNSHKVIALDCEGVNLGAAGQLTLVQIGLANGKIYIFDIIKEKSMVNHGGLKSILESESILKVIHDSRNDVANLYTEYGVKITPIFDTRVVHHLIVNKGVSSKKIPNRVMSIGFNELCSTYGGNLNVQKDKTKNVYKYNPSYWMSRPLTKNMIAYAAMDVAALVPHVFSTMLKQLKGIPENTLWQLNGKHSLSFLNDKDLLFD